MSDFTDFSLDRDRDLELEDLRFLDLEWFFFFFFFSLEELRDDDELEELFLLFFFFFFFLSRLTWLQTNVPRTHTPAVAAVSRAILNNLNHRDVNRCIIGPDSSYRVKIRYMDLQMTLLAASVASSIAAFLRSSHFHNERVIVVVFLVHFLDGFRCIIRFLILLRSRIFTYDEAELALPGEFLNLTVLLKYLLDIVRVFLRRVACYVDATLR